MKTLIDKKTAGDILLMLLGILLIIHIAVLGGLIPKEIVWGGHITTDTEFYVFETLAIVVTLIFAWITATGTGRIKTTRFEKTIRIGKWVVALYFMLNIVGNLAAETTLETLIFTPLSLIMAALAIRIALF